MFDEQRLAPPDPVVAVIAVLGERIISLETELRNVRGWSQQSDNRYQSVARELQKATEEIERKKNDLARTRDRDRALTEFVRGLARSNDPDRPPRSRAEAAARELLNRIGWTAW